MTSNEEAERAALRSEALVAADTGLLAFYPKGPWLIWDVRHGYSNAPSWLMTWDLWSLDDLDYVAAVPPQDGFDSPLFWEGGPFGCCCVEAIQTPAGWRLFAGYHS